jgi:hypothetical protein
MPEKKPEPNPKSKPEIPMGKLVGGKAEKPSAPKAKPAPAPTVPVPIARPLAAPAPAPAAVASEYDVDLVAVPCAPPRKPRDQRSLIDLDRRDFIMMGAGVFGSIIAVLGGLLMAKAFQRKPTDEKP